MSSEALQLPQYVHDHSHWLIEVPARIAVVLAVAALVRWLLLRSIDRLVHPRHPGDVPGVLRPFRERSNGAARDTAVLTERRAQRAATIGSVLKSAVSFTVVIVAFMVVLSELGIDLAPFIAGTSVVGVALGFGAQSIVKDFLAGMFMMLEDQYGVGDTIDFQLATGTVEAVGLRTTRLRDGNGTVWYVRNGEVLRVGNNSQGSARLVVDVPVAPTADLGRASAAVLDEAERLRADPDWAGCFLEAPQVEGVESMTLDQTVLRLGAQVAPGQQDRIARTLRLRIRERLDRLDLSPAAAAQAADGAAGNAAGNAAGDAAGDAAGTAASGAVAGDPSGQDAGSPNGRMDG